MPTVPLEVAILRDETAVRTDLQPGHGLSMLACVGEKTLLLDTGDSAQTWVNARLMGVDLAEVSTLVLSHGHYDHTNGLPALLRQVGRLDVVAHPAVFEPRYSDRGADGPVFIGPPLTREEFEELGASFRLSAEPVELAPGVTTTGHVPRVSDLAPEAPHLLVERDGKVIRDDFVDDLSIIVQLEEGDVLLTGCAHAGLVNIVARAEQITRRCPVTIIGGTHLAREAEERIERVALEMAQRGVQQIMPLHCSGERGARLLERYFSGEVLRSGTGGIIAIDDTGAIKQVNIAHAGAD